MRCGQVVEVTECGGGSLVELVYPPAGVLIERHTTSEYSWSVVDDVLEGTVTSCGVP